MDVEQSPRPQVFVSYAHESLAHKNDVMRFCEILRSQGVDVRVDEWEINLRRDWFVWMIDEIKNADHVVVIASPQYRVAGDGGAASDSHRGVQAESSILRDLLYGDRSAWTRKILPVILPGGSTTDIPLFLQPFTASYYQVAKINKPGVAELVGVITGQLQPRPLAGAMSPAPKSHVRWSAAPAVASRLPRDLVSFTGRNDELCELITRIYTVSARGDTAIHMVTGMPGIGKTAFIVHAAHQVTAIFPDGHLFLELHGHTPGQPPIAPVDAVGSLLLALGVAAQYMPATLEGRVAMWRGRLVGKKMLLIFDDVANHDQIRPLLPGTAGCQVVLTSRHRLAALEDGHPLPLNVLSTRNAVEMLMRITNRQPDGNELELVRLCGYLPLAIGLAAGRLRSHPTWDVSYLAKQLASTRNRLAEIRADDRTVEIAFTASYRDLSPEVQCLFRRLSLHPGVDFDLAAAAALSSGPLDVTSRRLETLYLAHLVEESAPGRFRLHDLVQYFAETLVADDPDTDRDAVIQRVLDHYVDVATEAAQYLLYDTSAFPLPRTNPSPHTPRFDGVDDATVWFANERINLSSCVHYSLRHDHAKHAVHLAAALHPYLAQQGNWDDALAINDVACRAAEHARNSSGLAVSLRNRGTVHHLLENYPAAMTDLVQAHQLCVKLGDHLGAAKVIHRIGVVRYSTGDHAAAIANLSAALALCEEMDDRIGVAEAFYQLGIVRNLMDDYASAISNVSRAYQVFIEIGSRQGKADSLSYLGLVQGMAGNLDSGSECLTRAVTLFEQIGDRRGVANALCRLSGLLRVLGEYHDAFNAGARAHALFIELGSTQGQANTLTDLAMARYLRSNRTADDYAAAVKSLTEALTLCGRIGNRLCEAWIHNNLGILRHLAGQFHEATESLNHAHDLSTHINHLTGKLEALNNLGRLAWDWPDAGNALSYHKQALALARNIGAQLEEAHALEGIGRCLAQDRYTAEGLAHLREALALYETLGVPQAQTVRTMLTTLA